MFTAPPLPQVGTIGDDWPRRTKPSLQRALCNIALHRLGSQFGDRINPHIPRPLRTTHLGGRHICFVYSSAEDRGHHDQLSTERCLEIAAQARAQQGMESDRRWDVVMLALWREHANADRTIHAWALPASVIQEMDRRLRDEFGTADGAHRNVSLRLESGCWRWVATANAQIWFDVNSYYQPWTDLTDAERTHINDLEAKEEAILRPR